MADHAGKSMWDGETDISRLSIGIELVGYHDASITAKQHRSVGLLIDILQRIYHLDDRAVWKHSQVATEHRIDGLEKNIEAASAAQKILSTLRRS